jgi:cytochrome c-type biogenesis protein CcmH/NrfG
VFQQATEFLAASQLAKAEAAYRQILHVDPAHARTLYVLGQLLSTKGDHWEAAKTYEALAAVAPTSVKVWSRLAGTYQALDRHSEAAGAFRKQERLKEIGRRNASSIPAPPDPLPKIVGLGW